MFLPKDIRNHLAKAKGYLHKENIPSALDSVSLALQDLPSQHVYSAKAMERKVNFLLQQISKHPEMQELLDTQKNGIPQPILYKHGKETVLFTVLRELSQMLRDKYTMLSEQKNMQTRLQTLLHKGKQALNEGKMGIASAFLRRAAIEFPDTLTVSYIGNMLIQNEQYSIAGDIFANNILKNPKANEQYTKAIDAFILAEEFDKAENIFELAIKQFGTHPRTLGRMAQLYALWDKEELALKYATQALALDSSESLAKTVVEIINEAQIKLPETNSEHISNDIPSDIINEIESDEIKNSEEPSVIHKEDIIEDSAEQEPIENLESYVSLLEEIEQSIDREIEEKLEHKMQNKHFSR